MKLRHPLLIRWLAFLASIFLRLYTATLRFRFRGPDGLSLTRVRYGERCIFAFWHEHMLLPAALFGGQDIVVLISQHADGELIAQIAQRMGFRTARGSTTRGGFQALRKLIAAGLHRHLCVTPDGPRGPRRTLEQGLVYLAAKTGLPIVPVGIAFENAWRLRTWDRFAVPKPFSDTAIVTGRRIRIPADTRKAGLERYRQIVEIALEEATQNAARLVRGLREPPARQTERIPHRRAA